MAGQTCDACPGAGTALPLPGKILSPPKATGRMPLPGTSRRACLQLRGRHSPPPKNGFLPRGERISSKRALRRASARSVRKGPFLPGHKAAHSRNKGRQDLFRSSPGIRRKGALALRPSPPGRAFPPLRLALHGCLSGKAAYASARKRRRSFEFSHAYLIYQPYQKSILPYHVPLL